MTDFTKEDWERMEKAANMNRNNPDPMYLICDALLNLDKRLVALEAKFSNKRDGHSID